MLLASTRHSTLAVETVLNTVHHDAKFWLTGLQNVRYSTLLQYKSSLRKPYESTLRP